MCALTFTYLAFHLSGSALAAVMVMVGYTLSYALFAPSGASILSRFDRRRAVLACDGIKLLNYSAVIILELVGLLDVPLIIAASAIGGLASGAQYPAWQEILQKLAPQGKLDETDALFSSASSIGAAVGALAGGAALAAFGPVPPLAFNVASYLPLMLAIAVLPVAVGIPNREEKEAGRVPLSEVIKMIGSNRLVWLGILFFALLEFLAWPIISLLPKLAAEFGSSAHIYGILLGAFYFGGILVAGLVVAAKRKYSYAGIIRFSLIDISLILVILAVVGFLPMGSVPSVLLASLLLATLGIVLGIAASVLGAVTQLSADPEHEGTILAYYAAIGLGAGAAGGMLEGFIADRLEIWWLPLASGILILVALLYLWSRHEFRVLDQADPNRSHMNRHHVTDNQNVDAPYNSKVAGGGSRPLAVGTAESGREGASAAAAGSSG